MSMSVDSLGKDELANCSELFTLHVLKGAEAEENGFAIGGRSWILLMKNIGELKRSQSVVCLISKVS